MTYTTNRTKQEAIIPPHGGFRSLKSFQMTEIIYDYTVEFCRIFVDKTNRTNRTYMSRMSDQMVQAARSGRQNIAEGSLASGTSKKTELKLVGVARASLGELLLDYEDFLRQRGLVAWGKEDPRVIAIRALSYRSYKSYTTYSDFLRKPEDAANAAICLLHQANYLLDQQLRAPDREFLEKGGFTERLYSRRASNRTYTTYRSYTTSKTGR